MPQRNDNLALEHLKKIQGEQSAARDRDSEMLTRLAHLENLIARLTRDSADNLAEVLTDRHSIDRLRERIERIERRLELQG